MGWAATQEREHHDQRGPSDKEVMINDVRRAYFNAKVTRDIYIEIPEEDKKEGESDMLGKLNLCLYGTRDAALNWQETLSSHLVSFGVRRGFGHPCVLDIL